jgi:hypothetical protein
MKFRDIPQFTRPSYAIDVSWPSLERSIVGLSSAGDKMPDLDPNFQRGHVWTEKQQRGYVEFCLRGGVGAREIMWNCSGWNDDFRGPTVLVDGKQRIEAVRRFMADELEILDGLRYSDFEDPRSLNLDPTFRFMVNNLPTQKGVLQWYVDLNAGGVAHTDEEIERVRRMIRSGT